MSTLDKLDINKNAIILNLNCKGDLRRRLLDLGLVNGTNIKASFKSPMGNPIAYEIRGIFSVSYCGCIKP